MRPAYQLRPAINAVNGTTVCSSGVAILAILDHAERGWLLGDHQQMRHEGRHSSQYVAFGPALRTLSARRREQSAA
jgi:hypothetical protein